MQKPNPEINKSYIGNLKLKWSYDKQIIQFFNKYTNKYILTYEDGGKENEHIHFYIESFKENKTLKLFREKLTLEFPQLVRKGQGGDTKYQIKLMKKKIQFNYIFKEVTCLNRLYSPYFNISMSVIKGYTHEYKLLKKIDSNMNKSSPKKFLEYITENKDIEVLKLNLQVDRLLHYYIEYVNNENGISLTTHDIERHLNYALYHIDNYKFYNIMLNKLKTIYQL